MQERPPPSHLPGLQTEGTGYTVEAVDEPSVNGEVCMELSYLIRYGLWHQVGRFASDSPDLERGQTVVVRSHRGTELGEVLIKIESTSGKRFPTLPSGDDPRPPSRQPRRSRTRPPARAGTPQPL